MGRICYHAHHDHHALYTAVVALRRCGHLLHAVWLAYKLRLHFRHQSHLMSEIRNFDYEDLPTRNVHMLFKFGDTKLVRDKVIDVPIKVKVLDEYGNTGVHFTEIPTYGVKGKVPYMLGLNTMESWKAKLDMGEKKGLEILLDNGTRYLKILTPKDKTHMKIGLQPLREKSLKQSVKKSLGNL